MSRVAYLINQYPKVSHTFIRRELQALERHGVDVLRFAVRGWNAEVADDADRAEREQTRYLLADGLAPLLLTAAAVLARSPLAFWRGLSLALRMARRGERSWPYHLVYLAEACRLLRWLRQSRCTHLHAHFGTNATEVAMICRCLGGPPYSFTVHGPEEFDKPEALHLREKIRAAAFVVAISSYGRSQLYRWADVDAWERIEVIRCGIETSFDEGAGTPGPDVARLVCVGRLCEQKGQLLLIRAVAQLIDAGTTIELVLAGDGEQRNEIETLVGALGVGGAVRITGWIDGAQVRREILASRALVLPSFAEGLPVVLMEAMALRRPVVSTFVAGVPELVEDGRTGWLVPAGDLDALVAALRACLRTDVAELARMGEAGRMRVSKLHDVDVETAKLARLFAAADAAPA
jgi:glycosyltransferase involved in cell wall biosynthesis